MGRKKTRAKRRVVIWSDDEEEVKVVTEEVVAVPSLVENSKDQEFPHNMVEVSSVEMVEESDPEIESFEEDFEEVDDVVSAVMEMDVKVKQEVIAEESNNGDAEGNVNFSNENVNLGSQCGLEESRNLDNKDAIEVKNSNLNGGLSAEEKNIDVGSIDKSNMASSSAGFVGKELDAVMDDSTAVVVGDSRNAIDVDDSKLLARAEENLVEEEPSVSKFENTMSDGPLTKADIVEENGDGEKENYGGRVFSEHSDKNEKSEVNRVPSSDDTSVHGRISEAAATPRHPSEGVLLQVKTVYLQRLPKSWDVEKLKETCKQYGLIKRVELFRNFGKKGNDVGFIAFTTRESALACIEGINEAQFGEVKVKADIMKPLVRGQLRKRCRGFKVKKMHRSATGLKIIGHAQLEVAQKMAKLTGQSVTNKSEMSEEMTMPIPEQDSQFLSNKRNTEQGGSNKSKSVVVEAHDGSLPSKSGKTGRRRRERTRGGSNNLQSVVAEAHDNSLLSKSGKTGCRRRERTRGGSNKLQSVVAEAHDDSLPSKSGKTDHEGRKGKRGGRQDYNKRPSKKSYGNLQVQNKNSYRNSKRKSHFRRKPDHTADSIPYRMSYAEDYATLSNGYPGYSGNAISRSKRPHSYMEPHAGYLEPVRKKDRYHKRRNEPSLIQYEQIYASYLEPSFQDGGVSRADYLQPAQARDSLPHAGLIEPGVKRSFDVDYTSIRTGAYNGVGEQGSAYRGGSTLPSTYALNYRGYICSQGTSRAGGYHQKTEEVYLPKRTHY